MAATRIGDIEFDADVYASMMQEDDPAKNAFVASGAVVIDEILTQRASGESDKTTIPYWNDLDNTTENISSDDPSQFATPQKIDSDKMSTVRIHVNNAWQTTNLAAEISSTDPMGQIQSRTSNYWLNRLSRRIQGIQTGIFLENEAASGDMIVDVSIEDGDNALAANLWSFDTFVDGYSTMGENSNKLAILAVHPEVMKQLRKSDKTEFIKDSETGLKVPFYNELRVVEDKRQPVIAGLTSGFRYVSTIYAAGAFGMGQALAKDPVVIETDELAGNGAGVETLIERKKMILHPGGYNFTSAAVVAISPTVAECANAANWERKFLRENVAVAWVVTNG